MLGHRLFPYSTRRFLYFGFFQVPLRLVQTLRNLSRTTLHYRYPGVQRATDPALQADTRTAVTLRRSVRGQKSIWYLSDQFATPARNETSSDGGGFILERTVHSWTVRASWCRRSCNAVHNPATHFHYLRRNETYSCLKFTRP